ncbi:helix-turn-helix transcriptional regulator [Nicoliella spurrieriana]|uniref:Helix-turn-helix transcriptional regulator n=1 Tax=Nicoliella spurrieriana TaxID=2925830 RepID=A0A976RST2_9LACO|nr:helix-turn-helix domain-containing protein [Nicoliella spurrieriana]UQS86931.1 helix-turn-helix transcriptional regulator [Nicoliella spurrieriana]
MNYDQFGRTMDSSRGMKLMETTDIRHDVRNKLQSGNFDCAKELTLSMFSGRHKMYILWELRHGDAIHFNQFTRIIPNVSRKVLTNQLNELIQDSIVEKRDYQEGRVKRASYKLTELGLSLIPILNLMYDWGEKRINQLKLDPVYQTKDFHPNV